jgi:hypothetical protein
MASSLFGGLGGAAGGGASDGGGSSDSKASSGDSGGGSGGGGGAPSAGAGGYQGFMSGASDGAVIAKDVLSQFSGQGSGPTDDNFIRNIFGTLLGDPGTAGPVARNPAEAAKLAAAGVKPGRARRSGVLGGILGGAMQALMGGTMGFIQNHGIEAVVNGLTAAGAAGPTPMAIVTGVMSFLGSGGAKAVAAAGDQGLGGFRKGGGMAATQSLAHEVGGNVGQMADKLTNGATSLALGGQNERPGAAPKPKIAGGGGDADADADAGADVPGGGAVDADADAPAELGGLGDLTPAAIKKLPNDQLIKLLKLLTTMADAGGAGSGPASDAATAANGGIPPAALAAMAA